MARLVWGDILDQKFTTGVDRGVLYPKDGPGVLWDGIVSITETNTGFTTKSYFVDGEKYIQEGSGDEFSASVVAYTYPEELDSNLDKEFGMSYRIFSESSVSSSYKIHLVYGITADFGEMVHASINGIPTPDMFTLGLTSTPENIFGFKPTAHIVVDTTKTHPWTLEALESALYGTETSQPYLPSANEVYELFESHAILRITDHGDGTWTADGPDEVITMLSATMFQIDWPSAIFLNPTTYKISSL